jgi:hypothetical protein
MFFQGTTKIADHFDGGEDKRNCQVKKTHVYILSPQKPLSSVWKINENLNFT